jgi:hypothetical protein
MMRPVSTETSLFNAMQIATILSLAGTVTCVGVFISHKKWLLALAFTCATAYTILTSVVHVAAVPAVLVQSLPYLFLALVVLEVLRKLVGK